MLCSFFTHIDPKTWPLDLLTLDQLDSTPLDSSAANSLSPFKPWTFFCRVFAVVVGLIVIVFSFVFRGAHSAQTVPFLSQILSFVYRHPLEAVAPTLRSGGSVCGRIALFDLSLVVSLVL